MAVSFSPLPLSLGTGLQPLRVPGEPLFRETERWRGDRSQLEAAERAFAALWPRQSLSPRALHQALARDIAALHREVQRLADHPERPRLAPGWSWAAEQLEGLISSLQDLPRLLETPSWAKPPATASSGQLFAETALHRLPSRSRLTLRCFGAHLAPRPFEESITLPWLRGIALEGERLSGALCHRVDLEFFLGTARHALLAAALEIGSRSEDALAALATREAILAHGRAQAPERAWSRP